MENELFWYHAVNIIIIVALVFIIIRLAVLEKTVEMLKNKLLESWKTKN